MSTETIKVKSRFLGKPLLNNRKSSQRQIPRKKLLAIGVSQHGVEMHRRLVTEVRRLKFYQRALIETVKNKVVLDIGTGSGILALLAAKEGAKHVYAIERNPMMAEIARVNIKASVWKHKITLIESDFSEVKNLPLIEVVVHEIFGTDPLGENILSTIKHSKRFISQQTVFVPNKVTYLVRAIHKKALIKPCFSYDDIQLPGLKWIESLPLSPPVLLQKQIRLEGKVLEGPSIEFNYATISKMQYGFIFRSKIPISSQQQDWAASFMLSSGRHKLWANGLGVKSNSSDQWGLFFFKKPPRSRFLNFSLNKHRTLIW